MLFVVVFLNKMSLFPSHTVSQTSPSLTAMHGFMYDNCETFFKKNKRHTHTLKYINSEITLWITTINTKCKTKYITWNLTSFLKKKKKKNNNQISWYKKRSFVSFYYAMNLFMHVSHLH